MLTSLSFHVPPPSSLSSSHSLPLFPPCSSSLPLFLPTCLLSLLHSLPSVMMLFSSQSSAAGGLDADQKDLSVSWLHHMTVMWHTPLSYDILYWHVAFRYTQTAVLNLQAKVALLDVGHINAIGSHLQVIYIVHVLRCTHEQIMMRPDTNNCVTMNIPG